jgi:hypothetical protein
MQVWRNCQVLSEQTSNTFCFLNAMCLRSVYATMKAFFIFRSGLSIIRINSTRKFTLLIIQFFLTYWRNWHSVKLLIIFPRFSVRISSWTSVILNYLFAIFLRPSGKFRYSILIDHDLLLPKHLQIVILPFDVIGSKCPKRLLVYMLTWHSNGEFQSKRG